MFKRLVWRPDRMLLGDLVFRLAHYKSESWDGGESCFEFYKIKPLIDQYEAFWSRRPDFRPRNVFELGVWDGGSSAFWFEYFQPAKHVGADLTRRPDRYFQDYVRSRQLGPRLKIHWGIDQADARTLRKLVASEFDGPLDLVIDDASHLYGPTKASFETLFPLLRPGGLYVIEDWAWGHWPGFHAPGHAWARETPPTRLVTELVEATGTSTTLISSLVVLQGFVVVERGPIVLPETTAFTLEAHILRRPR